MKLITTISFLLVLIFVGCSTSKDYPVNTHYTFEYEGVVYEIVGYHGDDNPANFLVYRVDNETIFRAVDRNLNSNIDYILTGDIELSVANEIYNEGIRQALADDKFKETDKAREFDMVHEEYRLVIQSIPLNGNEFMNRFTIFDLEWRTVAQFIDENGDGELNRVELGEINLEEAQEFYQIAVEQAGEENRFDREYENQFILTLDEPILEIRENHDQVLSLLQ